jgi:hypothetical protein
MPEEKPDTKGGSIVGLLFFGIWLTHFLDSRFRENDKGGALL